MRSLLPLILAIVAALHLLSCGPSLAPGEQLVHLPDGTEIVAETKLTPDGQAQGMMFRSELLDDRGMLFIHPGEDKRGYWMFQCEIPLDIIWMDRNHRVVEISANTPPCREAAEKCPSYGGNVPSTFVLELAGGVAKSERAAAVGDRGGSLGGKETRPDAGAAVVGGKPPSLVAGSGGEPLGRGGEKHRPCQSPRGFPPRGASR